MGYSWELLADPSWLLLLVVVLITLFVGAMRSLSFLVVQTQQPSEVREASELKVHTAVLLPIVGSIMLVALFFYLEWLSILLVIVFSLSSFVSVTYALAPIFAFVARKLNLAPEYQPIPFWAERFSTSILMSAPIALTLLILWLVFRYWLLTDFLALCLGVTALAFLRLPNLMISSIVLWLFFFYDIFWVFLSAHLFGKNVMVHVATQLPTLPIVLTVPRIILEGYSLLGLGDIILPGLYLAFLYRFDYSRYHWQTWAFTGYFRVGLISYAVGFVWTFVMLIALQMAQPALLYLVPSIMIPTVAMSLIKKEFMLLWRGSAQPSVTVVNVGAAEQELQEMEAGMGHSKSTAYAPVDSIDDDESAIEIQPSYTIADESDEEEANRADV